MTVMPQNWGQNKLLLNNTLLSGRGYHICTAHGKVVATHPLFYSTFPLCLVDLLQCLLCIISIPQFYSVYLFSLPFLGFQYHDHHYYFLKFMLLRMLF